MPCINLRNRSFRWKRRGLPWIWRRKACVLRNESTNLDQARFSSYWMHRRNWRKRNFLWRRRRLAIRQPWRKCSIATGELLSRYHVELAQRHK